jgi:hypothetical protein
MKKSGFVLLLVFVYFTSCVTPEPACNCDSKQVLFDVFCSNQTISSFKKQILNKSDTLLVIENSSLDKNDKRPPFTIYQVSIPNYSSGIINGKLEALFFNDKLMRIGFTPVNSAIFHSIPLNSCCISVSVSTDKSQYTFTDVSLNKELFSWITKYA